MKSEAYHSSLSFIADCGCPAATWDCNAKTCLLENSVRQQTYENTVITDSLTKFVTLSMLQNLRRSLSALVNLTPNFLIICCHQGSFETNNVKPQLVRELRFECFCCDLLSSRNFWFLVSWRPSLSNQVALTLVRDFSNQVAEPKIFTQTSTLTRYSTWTVSIYDETYLDCPFLVVFSLTC